MRIAAWNVNSVRIRKEHINRYIEEYKIDILLLQETKVIDELFPIDDINLKYAIYSGQKSYNGVAILSRYPISNSKIGFNQNNMFDNEARVISGEINNIEFISVYAVNGREIDHNEYYRKEKYYQLLAEYKNTNKKQIFGGDFNICPTENDVYNPQLWKKRISCSENERKWYHNFASSFNDPMQDHHNQWTWWSYMGNCLNKDYGLRIDHFLVSQDINVIDASVHKDVRFWTQASDHAPIFMIC